MNLSNLTLDTRTIVGNFTREAVQYRTYKAHAIDLVDIFIAVAGYAVLAYFWIKVNKNKEHYQKWVNPKGRVVNLYKVIKKMMIIYPVVVILMSALQIYLVIINTA
jgi:hypothetical protein